MARKRFPSYSTSKLKRLEIMLPVFPYHNFPTGILKTSCDHELHLVVSQRVFVPHPISCLSLDFEGNPVSLNYKLPTIEFKSYLRLKCTSLQKTPQTIKRLCRISSCVNFVYLILSPVFMRYRFMTLMNLESLVTFQHSDCL